MSISGWMDKEYMVYTHNGILISLIKENPAICSNTGEPRGHSVKWNKPDKEGQILPYTIYMTNLK